MSVQIPSNLCENILHVRKGEEGVYGGAIGMVHEGGGGRGVGCGEVLGLPEEGIYGAWSAGDVMMFVDL
jgi:hypothetical protein